MSRSWTLIGAGLLALAAALGAMEKAGSDLKDSVTSDDRALSVKPQMAYSARGRKDPFLAPQFRHLQQDPASVLIRQITLVGMVQSGQTQSAMFRQGGGALPTLTFRGGHLYYDRTHTVTGVTGRILDSRRVVLKQDEDRITYTLFLNHR
jgi:hypothetical protein